MENDNEAKVTRVRDIHLYFNSKNVIELKDVHYVPTLRRNLISRSIFNRLGYKLVLKFNKFIMSRGIIYIY